MAYTSADLGKIEAAITRLIDGERVAKVTFGDGSSTEFSDLQLDELRRWQTVTLGREGRVLEMKKEVNELLKRLGEPPRYASVEAK